MMDGRRSSNDNIALLSEGLGVQMARVLYRRSVNYFVQICAQNNQNKNYKHQ